MLEEAATPIPVKTATELAAALSTLAAPKDAALATYTAANADKPFEDPDFPATNASLANAVDKDTLSRVRWKRLTELCSSEELAVFAAPLDASDMMQGSLGDCYLLASVAALSQRAPQRMIQVFVTRQVNRVGMFTVQLYVGLQATRITIDDMVPCVKDGSTWRPLFARSRSPTEMYVTKSVISLITIFCNHAM